MTPLHVVAGLLGLLSGALALGAAKGGGLHRSSGRVFVGAMLLMSATGAGLAAVKPDRLSVLAGVLAFYLVSTALLTVRPPRAGARHLHVLALLAALGVALGGAALSAQALLRGAGTIDGNPMSPGFVFAAVAAVAAIGDARLLLGRRLDGPRRLARHLWRMGFALLLATASFFLGQPQLFPRAVRSSGLLPVPVLLVLLSTLFWLVRVRLSGWRPRVATPRGAPAPRQT